MKKLPTSNGPFKKASSKYFKFKPSCLYLVLLLLIILNFKIDGQPFTASTVDNFYSAWAVWADDIDDDGDVDIAGTAYYTDDVVWWENDGNELFTKYVIASNFTGAFAPYAVDIDKDGDKDILAAAQIDDKIAWWENNGSESFTYHLLASNFLYVSGLYPTDIDGDSNIDFVAASYWTGNVVWWQNDLDFDGDGFRINDGDCDDYDENVYPGATEYCDGVDNNCDGEIDETDLEITSPSCVSVFYGYDLNSSCEEISVSASGGTPPYSYHWSHDPGTDDETALVCAEEPDDFTVTVEVTDALYCTAETNILVKVTDLRCSNNPNSFKILVCHIPPGKPNKQKTLCIGIDDVAEHLSHGDYLGTCNMPPPCNSAQQQSSIQNSHEMEESIPEWTEEHSFTLYPNPVNQDLYVQFNSPMAPLGILRITNYMGQLVDEYDLENLQENPVRLDISGSVNGYYTITLQTKDGAALTKSFVVHH